MKNDFYNKKSIRREERCGKCPHPSYKCLICGKAKDNIISEEKAEIAILKEYISKRNTVFLYERGNMEEMVKEKVKQYEATKSSMSYRLS